MAAVDLAAHPQGDPEIRPTSPFTFTFIEDGSEVYSLSSRSNVMVYYVNMSSFSLDVFW
jgi:hypothetical protein